MNKILPIEIGGYLFACYRLADSSVVNSSAIYVILGIGQDGIGTVLDVGQTGELGERIDSHPHRNCWFRNCPTNNIWVCILPTPTPQFSKEQRLAMELKFRQTFNPPCGQR